MDIRCVTRKRIWEVDCWSLDAALAASFEWRDFANLLRGHGHALDLSKPETLIELRAQCLVHDCCHSENPVSLKLENLMNDWHRKMLDFFDRRTPSEVVEFVLTVDLEKQASTGALFWALGSDARDGFDCIRRRFHQRFQIFSARRPRVHC